MEIGVDPFTEELGIETDGYYMINNMGPVKIFHGVSLVSTLEKRSHAYVNGV